MTVRNCIYRHVGCQFQADEKSLQTHEQDGWCHFSVIVIRCDKMKVVIQKLREENAKLKNSLEHCEQHCNKFKASDESSKNVDSDSQRIDTDFESNDDSIDVLKDKALHVNVAKLKELVDSLDTMREKFESFSSNMEKFQKEQIELNEKMEKEITKFNDADKVARIEQKRSMENIGEVKDNMAVLKQSLEKVEVFIQQRSTENIENVKKDVDDVKKSLKKVEGDIQKNTVKISSVLQEDLKNCIFVWKIENFSKKLEQAKDGFNTTLYSEPFYTKPFGYKLRLFCYPNGNFEDRYISIFIQLMKGEMDDILKWPFNYKCTLMLVNQIDDKNHQQLTIDYPEDYVEFQKPENITGVRGRGKKQFMSHLTLLEKDSPYFRNDTLFIKAVINCSTC